MDLGQECGDRAGEEGWGLMAMGVDWEIGGGYWEILVTIKKQPIQAVFEN